MAFPDSFVEEVRRTADIVRYISEHVPLRKTGASWKGLCPFHHEKTPSFNVRQEPPLFHCFGCGEGGDVFKFVMLHERVGFPEAVETVARRFGVPVPERGFDAGPDRKHRDEMLALLEAAAAHFSRNFWSAPGARARDYLLGRGFKKETLERIRAGAAPDSWDDLLGALRKKFAPALMLSAGLVLERQDGKGHYDRFRGRAVFPILNEGGKVVAFGARSLDGSEPKYLNSPETPVYQKSRTLYGLSWAKDAVRREGRVVLMEGYLDVARAIESGVTEVAATCGTALTTSHARLLRRFADRVVMNFDQDEAGQKASRRSAEVLVEEALPVRVVELPAGEDPDTYLQKAGADAYRKRLAEAPVYMEWLIRRAAVEHDTGTPQGKAEYLNALLPAVVRIESAVERAAWLPLIVSSAGLDERAAEQELRRAVASRRSSVSLPAAASEAPAEARAGLLPAEKWLLALMLEGREGVGGALDALQDADLQGLRSEEVLRAAKGLAAAGRAVAPETLGDAVGEESRRMLREIAVDGPPTTGVTPADCARELKCRPLKARMAEIQRDLGRASGPDLEALLAEKLQLKRQMAALWA
ncbi:MAG: DNA primase [Acidobacteria bacterium]|nr:MAG: DNA primase [Acidobacteriota bacterium]PYQ22375.1 MAG: DNA primase [Acidobacteriota bacterium]